MRIPTNKEPIHPGEMLREEFLFPINITHKELADAIHVPYQRINELVNKKCGITLSTALLLGMFFGISPDFWLTLQMRSELFKTQVAEQKDIEPIKNYHHIEKMA